MGKIKITKEQYNKLIIRNVISESQDVKGGNNRVNTLFKKQIPSISKSIMSSSSKVNEDIGNTDFHEAIQNFIKNIWLTPSKKIVDDSFSQNNISWDEIATYLENAGVLTNVNGNEYKVNNFFKRTFSKDTKEAMEQKMQDIEKITKQIANDPKAPWNQTKDSEIDEEIIDQDTKESAEDNEFKAVGMGKEFVILNASDGMYIFDHSDMDKKELTPENLADFVNKNINNLSKGEGVEAFYSNVDLIKIDEKLKEELNNLYSKDKKFIELLNRLKEMTSTGSAGAYTGLFSGGDAGITKGYSPAKQIDDIINDEEELYKGKIDEMSTAGGTPPISTPTGQYTQPAIWAKDEKNWKGNKKTQWPGGSFVEFDDCTKLNNNKDAQNGKCSVGASDNVIKLKKSKGNVNAPSLAESIYLKIAEKTGKSVIEIKNIIETKLHNNNSLTKN